MSRVYGIHPWDVHRLTRGDLAKMHAEVATPAPAPADGNDAFSELPPYLRR